MKRLVKLQVRNIFHNKLFYVCLILTLVLNNLGTFLLSVFGKDAGDVTIFGQITSLLTTGVDIIGMLFITIYCTFDFNEGTTKNIIGRGYSRIKFLFSKYIGSLIGIFSMELIVSVVIFLLYAKNGLGWESNMSLIMLVGIVKIITFTIVYSTIAFIVEKNSIAIIINLVLPNIITLLFGMSDSNLHTHMSKYWIENVGSKFASKATASNMGFPLIMYLVYTLIFVGLGMYFANRKEIK